MPKTKLQSKQSGFIRLISGKHRGRKLPVKNVEGLRPTTDRVKETLFNWLMHDVRDSLVIDCFAGSGSLGFEALSRFAQSVTFFELDTQAAKQIQANIDTLNATSQSKIIQGDALKLLSNAPQKPANLVFVDPPFRKSLLEPCCQLLESNNWLVEDALIYIEYEKELSPSLPKNWKLIKEKSAGQVISALYQRLSS